MADDSRFFKKVSSATHGTLNLIDLSGFDSTGRVGLGGIGYKFGDDIAGNGIECSEHTFPSLGAGVSYIVKEEASLLIRLEMAKGKKDNETLYFRFEHAF